VASILFPTKGDWIALKPTFASLGRKAMISKIRLDFPENARQAAKEFGGPMCEVQADAFLAPLPWNPVAGQWSWAIRVQLVLEDETVATAFIVIEAGQSLRPVRYCCTKYFAKIWTNENHLEEYREEARRIAELLCGATLPEPLKSGFLSEFLDRYWKPREIAKPARVPEGPPRELRNILSTRRTIT
jgi:hypothetical protein